MREIDNKLTIYIEKDNHLVSVQKHCLETKSSSQLLMVFCGQNLYLSLAHFQKENDKGAPFTGKKC